MSGLHKLVISLAAVLGIASVVSSSGCRYQNMGTMGAISSAPYVNLECFEPGNDEGFSFEIPACSCSAGIRLRYFAGHTPAGGLDIQYEYESGVHDDLGIRTRMVSHSISGVERLIIAGRELPHYDQCGAADKEQWDIAAESFVSAWANYAPVVDRMFTTCTEDRIDEQMDALQRK